MSADRSPLPALLAFVLVSTAGCADFTSRTSPRPIEPDLRPEVDWNPFAAHPLHPGNVGTLRPHLCWQPFELAAARAADPWYLEVDDLVRYDVRVWRLGPRAVLVYERSGLESCEHTLESDLEPATSYRWSVRARFERQGEPRLSDWSTALGNWRFNPFHGSEGYAFRTPDG